MIGIQQARPPFVEFKQIAKEDKPKTLELGRRVTKNVDMAFIMQPGSRDQLEIEANQWLASIKRKMLEATADSYPQEWVEQFHKKYDMWKQGLEAPPMGTSVREWPVLSPAEIENFIACKILTVEDIAAMTEQAMGSFGMGARALREKAREWLQAKEVAGAVQKENEELKRQLAELSARLEQIESDKPKRGRPKLAEAA
jgi:hypothetical protein